jgi:hypothetical protein
MHRPFAVKTMLNRTLILSGLLACHLSLLAQPPSAPAGPTPAAPESAEEAEARSKSPGGTPAPSSQPTEQFGSNDAFSYSHTSSDPTVAVIYPNSGGDPVFVSSSFLGMMLRNQQLTNEQKLKAMQSYRQMNEQAFDRISQQSLPDKSVQTEPFADTTLTADGRTVVLSQDPLASPYVRVSVAGSDGKVQEEFSIAKDIVDKLVKSNATPEKKLEGLSQFPLRLPEDTRSRFDDMNTTGLMESAIASQPKAATQEMIRMHQFFSKLTTDSLAAMAAETTRTRGTTREISSTANDAAPGRDMPSKAAEDASKSPSTPRPGSPAKPAPLILIAVFIAAGIAGLFLFRRRF